MKSIIIVIALLQTPDPTVAVVMADRTLLIRKSEAEALYKITDPQRDLALYVALNHALGTAPVEPCRISWAQHVAEVQSWWAAPERKPPCESR